MPVSMRTRLYDAASAARIWRYRRNGMQIGRECKISGSAKLDQTNPRGLIVGDHTAISFNASILTHNFIAGQHQTTRIGSNCFIGACSVILPGVSIGDNAIVGAGSVVFSDVPSNTVVSGNPARVVETGIVTGKWGIRNPKFLAREGIQTPAKGPTPAPTPLRSAPTASARPGATLQSYFPGVPLDQPFADSGIDSFALITLRAQIEENEGIQISDEAWTAIERPADLQRFITRPQAATVAAAAPTSATATRRHEINMPQMSMKGLSESWLFKEIGDIHWSLITGALGVKSNAIADQEGNRLYATFTRIRYGSTVPLAEIKENDDLTLDAAMTRFGAGMFFSKIEGDAAANRLTFELMSSFSRFGTEGDNRSLLKGQPAIPQDFIIPGLSEMPVFADEYRAARSAPAIPAIFETDYQIVPVHDINGVGLLYFAAYPIINEICVRRYLGEGVSYSPIARDVCYFANSGSNDTVRFVIAEWNEEAGQAKCLSYLVRNDGKQMASIRTTYALG